MKLPPPPEGFQLERPEDDEPLERVAAPSGARVNYITAAQCGRTDAGTSAIYVTFNDDASTIMVLPNSGGGGGNNMTFPSPLMVAGAFKFTASSGVSTLYCNAQGFTGN